ncbi:uncharacterized protein DUF222 [Pseudonocardia sediminis]|uniref:Uncharacterized protein DUF222 n=1 Tax=Pseudonocardia sediminis TaxID=1397368 RepID=A0A4Q7UUP6_PSEST|nr:DUF222 domain-containing protein [Pseudonocardia sediminis]RZT84551.1 uncharacterized protein DUF222 [Pseudonocardia sediminis]
MFAVVEDLPPVEDPCPHGIPAWLCGDLCPENGTLDDEPPAEAVVDLDQAPGARLALQCQSAGSVPELLSDGEVLDVVQGTEAILRWASGLRTRMLATFADRHPAGTTAAPPGADPVLGLAPVQRWLPDEVGLTLGIPRLEASGEIARARRFTHVLSDTLAALEQGRIDERRADAIARATAVLPDEKAREVEAAVLSKASDATLRQVRDRLRRAIAKIDPDGEYRRHTTANTERRVSIRSLEDGMASLWFYGSAEQIEAAWQMADRLARALGPDDPRTLDQRRFDLAMQVLQGRLTVTDLNDLDTAVTDILASGDGSGTDDGCGIGSDSGTDQGCTGGGGGTDSGGTTGGGGMTGHQDDTHDPGDNGGPHGSGTHDSEAGVGSNGPDTSPAPEADSADRPTTRSRHDPSTDPPAERSTDRSLAGPRVDPDTLADAVAQALTRRPDLHTTVRTPLIHVVVGLDALLPGSDGPAELIGHGPITADTARTLAADGLWKRLVTDPLSGTLLDLGRTTYTPSAGLRDHVLARDHTCRGPHCGRKIRDLDHHQEWTAQHGPTAEHNLHGYCQHHHQLKDAPGWQVIAHPDRSLTWISPTGRRHTTEPYDYRAFTDRPAEHLPEQVEGDGPATRSVDTDDDPPPF